MPYIPIAKAKGITALSIKDSGGGFRKAKIIQLLKVVKMALEAVAPI